VSSIKKLALPIENHHEEKRPFKNRGHSVGDRVMGGWGDIRTDWEMRR